MLVIKSSILILFLVGFGEGALKKEGTAEGECVVIPRDDGEIDFFLKGSKGGKWYLTMASQFGARYNAELMHGHPAADEKELKIGEPIILISDDDPFTMIWQTRDVVLKGECVPKRHSNLRDYFCEIYKTHLKPGQTYENEGINWRLLGHPSTTIIKTDAVNKYIIFNLCSTVHNVRYWLSISQSRTVSLQVQQKMFEELQLTGFYQGDGVYIEGKS